MQSQALTIVNRLGLHARAAARFVSLAAQFNSEIILVRNDRQVNGKSIMGIMMLAAGQGANVELRVDGDDEDEAMKALCGLIAGGFGEDE
ncbi:MAG: HPr family phosphocarrier protein [Gammaproteobacteria bacterium]|jgi:phosphocarrier protein|nr:HPr family phosphocarrier protein [Gammaproteobacteria bacterium]